MAFIGNMEAKLGEVVQLLAQVSGVTLACICLVDDEQHIVQVLAMAGGSGLWTKMAGRSFFYDPAYGLPIQQPNPTVVRAPAQLPGLPANIRGELTQGGIEQVLAAPLVARNQIIGVLTLLTDEQDRVFTADELRVAQTIAGQVATAI